MAQLIIDKKKGKDINEEMKKLTEEKETNLLPASITFNDADISKDIRYDGCGHDEDQPLSNEDDSP